MTDRKPSNVHYLFPRQDAAEEEPTEPYPTNQVADPELEKWTSWLIRFAHEYARRG